MIQYTLSSFSEFLGLVDFYKIFQKCFNISLSLWRLTCFRVFRINESNLLDVQLHIMYSGAAEEGGAAINRSRNT